MGSPSPGKKIRLVLASSNRHKYREFSDFFKANAAFAKNGAELSGPREFPGAPTDVEETGGTYEANALIKARAWADFTGLPCLADDSGLEVRSLGWAPGIHSARVAPGDDRDRARWLLTALRGVSDRRARFVACLVVAFPSSYRRGYFSVEGRCWGDIAHSPAGETGFGYDPVFIPDGYDKTFGDLGQEVKSEISHRAIAMRGLSKIITSVIKYISV
jgi:XTP/dITP diphosphohydrolase